MRRNRQSGQAIIIVVLGVGLVLMGALGLAIDSGQLYAHRQMAQAAADAAAQAAVLSIYAGTNVGTNAFGSSAFNCTAGTDGRSPCAFSRLNGFGTSGSADTVAVDFPSSVAGVSLSSNFTPAAAHVLISRPVNATFLRLLGAAATTTIKAAATAAIVQVVSPIPIVVTHPSLSQALSMSGSGHIQICGGPQLSIQVNSNNATAYSIGGSETVDLSHAGPADTLGNCTTGTGSDFGTFGGPSSTGFPSWLTPTGSTEHFYQPNLPIPDPFANVSPPTQPANAPAPTALAAGVGDCPATASSGCTVYRPGTYPFIGVDHTMAIFNPGIYYINNAPTSGSYRNTGFGGGANSGMMMCAANCVPDTSGNFARNGMLVYLDTAGGVFSVGSNGSANLLGSDHTGAFKGILFFSARNAPAHTGQGSSPAHLLGGGGAMTLTGTIYITNTNMTSTNYQKLQIQGNAGSSTLVKGEIITSTLLMGGGGSIVMQLDPNSVVSVDQVALVK